MVRTKHVMLSFLGAICMTFLANGPVSAEPLHLACKADIDLYCDTVTPGNGRLMACLYAHEDKVSASCDLATDDVGAILDTAFATILDVMANCEPDIAKHCGGEEFGEGRILTCLHESSASLTKACKAAVPPISGRLAN